MSVKLGVRVRVSVNHNLYSNLTLTQHFLKEIDLDHGPGPAPTPTPTPTPRHNDTIVEVASRSRKTKPIAKHGNVHCDWFILPLLPPIPIWFSLDRKRQSHKGSRRKMETF